MKSLSFDLLVFGATPAGIVASIHAAREGMRVGLVSVHERIGGMWSNGVQVFDTIYEGERAPLLAEILERLQAWNANRYGIESKQYKASFFGPRFESGGRPRFSPQCGLEVLTELVTAEPNIHLLKPYAIRSVQRNGRQLQGVTLRPLGNGDDLTVDAAIFMDASYEGDLFAAAGEEYRVGREARSEYGEPHAGKIFTQRGGAGRHPYDAVCGRLNLRTFRLTTTEIFSGSTGEGDLAVQSYNARLALSSEPENRLPIPRPYDYDRNRYLGLLKDHTDEPEIRYPLKSDLLFIGIGRASLGTRVGKVDGWNPANYPEANWRYPEADWEERFQIIRAHIDHALGMIHFLQTDDAVPEPLRERNLAWGLPADEYPESGHLPVEIYVREARRLVGRVVMTENDGVLAPGRERTRDYDDSIAFTEWPMDSHDCTLERRAGSLNDGIILLTELTRPASVPYRSILPRGVDNLLVPVCLSATHVFWGTVRVEPTWVHIAQSAAVAAVLAFKTKVAPAHLSTEALQIALLDQRLAITFFNDVNLALPDETARALSFFACRGFFDSYDACGSESLDPLTRTRWLTLLASSSLAKHCEVAAFLREAVDPADTREGFLVRAFQAIRKAVAQASLPAK